MGKEDPFEGNIQQVAEGIDQPADQLFIGALPAGDETVLEAVGGNPAVDGKREGEFTRLADKEPDQPGRSIDLSVIEYIDKAAAQHFGAVLVPAGTYACSAVARLAQPGCYRQAKKGGSRFRI